MTNPEIQLSLCLEMLFRDWPFVDRMKAAARLGYRAIEFWDWRDKDIAAIERESERLGIRVAAISGNRKHSLIEPSHRDGLLSELDQVLEVAAQLRCRHIMLLADILNPDGSAAALPHARSTSEKQTTIREGLSALAQRAEGKDVMFLLEPLNTVLDHKGCFLDSSSAGVELVRAVNHPQVRMLYDVYHMSMMGEDAAAEVGLKIPWIGYFHAADVPGRHEPGSGALPWRSIRNALDRAGYRGFVGMEFSASGTEDAAVRRSLAVFSE